ncbi:MAG: Rrf2 family transcriptional regulator [Candidatus Zixiibacteriota bacterium]
MQFTKAEEYGLFGLIYLAKQPSNAVATLREISMAQDVPDKFLAKIFQNLTKAGIVKSHRGVRGGFSLARPAKKITIAEVFDAIQANSDPIKCVINRSDCPKKYDCPVRDLVLEGRRQMFSYYGRHTVQSLADQYD